MGSSYSMITLGLMGLFSIIDGHNPHDTILLSPACMHDTSSPSFADCYTAGAALLSADTGRPNLIVVQSSEDSWKEAMSSSHNDDHHGDQCSSNKYAALIICDNDKEGYGHNGCEQMEPWSWGEKCTGSITIASTQIKHPNETINTQFYAGLVRYATDNDKLTGCIISASKQIKDVDEEENDNDNDLPYPMVPWLPGYCQNELRGKNNYYNKTNLQWGDYQVYHHHSVTYYLDGDDNLDEFITGININQDDNCFTGFFTQYPLNNNANHDDYQFQELLNIAYGDEQGPVLITLKKLHCDTDEDCCGNSICIKDPCCEHIRRCEQPRPACGSIKDPSHQCKKNGLIGLHGNTCGRYQMIDNELIPIRAVYDEAASCIGLETVLIPEDKWKIMTPEEFGEYNLIVICDANTQSYLFYGDAQLNSGIFGPKIDNIFISSGAEGSTQQFPNNHQHDNSKEVNIDINVDFVSNAFKWLLKGCDICQTSLYLSLSHTYDDVFYPGKLPLLNFLPGYCDNPIRIKNKYYDMEIDNMYNNDTDDNIARIYYSKKLQDENNCVTGGISPMDDNTFNTVFCNLANGFESFYEIGNKEYSMPVAIGKNHMSGFNECSDMFPCCNPFICVKNTRTGKSRCEMPDKCPMPQPKTWWSQPKSKPQPWAQPEPKHEPWAHPEPKHEPWAHPEPEPKHEAWWSQPEPEPEHEHESWWSPPQPRRRRRRGGRRRRRREGRRSRGGHFDDHHFDGQSHFH